MIDSVINEEYIEHSADKNGYIEKSNRKAFLLDGDKGIFPLLKFQRKVCLKIVDYIRYKSNDTSHIYLIELTDLKNDIKDCIECEALLRDTSTDVRNFVKSLDHDGLKRTQKKLWLETTEEVKGKWMGSIACYERILRIRNENIYPKYHLVIVLKNDTDPKELDLFKTELNNKLSGMTGRIEVLTTGEL